MSSRRIHRFVGLLMLVPMICWAFTGMVFFLKPGYKGAYEVLSLKTYPLDGGAQITLEGGWDEIRVVKSILGVHLLAKKNGVFVNLDPLTQRKLQVPEEPFLSSLFEDAISANVERYGSIARVENTVAHTTTGIKIELDWNNLTFTQQGFDRLLISAMYKIHYLQWTPWDDVNKALGVVGLLLLVLLSGFGIRVYCINR